MKVLGEQIADRLSNIEFDLLAILTIVAVSNMERDAMDRVTQCLARAGKEVADAREAQAQDLVRAQLSRI